LYTVDDKSILILHFSSLNHFVILIEQEDNEVVRKVFEGIITECAGAWRRRGGARRAGAAAWRRRRGGVDAAALRGQGAREGRRSGDGAPGRGGGRAGRGAPG